MHNHFFIAQNRSGKRRASRVTVNNSHFWLGDSSWLGTTYCHVSHGEKTLWAAIKFIFRRRKDYEKVGDC